MAYRGGRPPTDCFINCPINYYRGSIHKLYKACCTVDATKYYYTNVSVPNCCHCSCIAYLFAVSYYYRFRNLQQILYNTVSRLNC